MNEASGSTRPKKNISVLKTARNGALLPLSLRQRKRTDGRSSIRILDGKRQQCSLLLSLFAHESVVGAYVIQQMADRLFSVGNRCSALLAFTQMLQVFLMGNSCVYAIDMVKLRCGWFNPSDIYKIGGSVMFRFMQKQSGLSHFGFWPSPHLWTGQLKIYHVGA